MTMLTEAEGCALLTRLFEARGYRIARDVPFQEGTVAFDIDGWDAEARVGFEYLSSEAEDHEDLTLAAYETLTARMRLGELFVFIIDESEPPSPAELAAAANQFLDDVQDVRSRAGLPLPPKGTDAPSKATPAKAAPAKAAPAKKPAKKASKKKPAKKKAAKKKKPAKKKPAKKAAKKKPAKKKPAKKKPAKKKH